MDNIEISQSDADLTLIREKLNKNNFNLVPNAHHEGLNLTVRRQSNLIARLIGETYGNWLYVGLFWVHEGERSHGLGTRILAKAEEIAVQRGCKHAHLETHDFQGHGFFRSGVM